MAAPDDVAAVTALLGRPPQADFDVVVRNAVGVPMVVRNAPFTVDGTPMPTRYWLVDPELNAAIARIEAAGGVRAAQAAIDPAVLQAAHDRHRAERDAAVEALAPGHTGPRPYGGVAGTREGVKCLHAHYAWFLAGGDDPVGHWVDEQLHTAAPAPIAGETPRKEAP